MSFSPLPIAERLGHEKVQTILDTYNHPYPNKQIEVANNKISPENPHYRIIKGFSGRLFLFQLAK